MNKWKHFLIFSVILLFLIFIEYYFGRYASPGDIGMRILNIIAFLQIPLILVLLIRTYKSKERLKFRGKFLFLVGLELVMPGFTILINIINPFGRKIFLEEIWLLEKTALDLPLNNGIKKNKFLELPLILCKTEVV